MTWKLAVLDLSENGQQIAEKLLTLLNDRLRQELLKYICHSLEQPVSAVKHPCATSNSKAPGYIRQAFNGDSRRRTVLLSGIAQGLCW